MCRLEKGLPDQPRSQAGEVFPSEDQAKFGKFSARFLGVSVQDGMEAQARGDVAQEWAIFYVGDLLGLYVRDVHRPGGRCRGRVCGCARTRRR